MKKIGGYRKEIITYQFAATIKDKKARDRFKGGPLKIQLVLETIEIDNYNRKYGDTKPRNKKPKKTQQTVHRETNRLDTPIKHRTKNQLLTKREKYSNCRFGGKPNWTLEHICPALRSQSNNCKKMGHFAKVCKSKTVNRIREAPSSGIKTESWPKINLIQSVNGINRVDFYKAILLVQGHPIEFIIDTGSPVTIIPRIINPIEKTETKQISWM